MKPNDLKLKITIREQIMTLWEISKQTDTYIMFKASITSGKKKPDGTWDNINQTFTCFANGEAMNFLNEKFAQKAKVKVTGVLTLLPEKRTAMGRNGEYQETIFSNPTMNIDKIELLEMGENGYSNSYSNAPSSKEGDYSAIDDDIPF